MSVTIAELNARFTANTANFDAGNKRVQQGLKTTQSAIATTAGAMEVLAAAAKAVGTEFAALSGIFASTGAEAANFGKMAGASFAALTGLSGALTAEIGGLRAEMGSLNRSFGSKSVGNYQQKISASTAAVSSLGAEAKVAEAQIRSMNKAMGGTRSIQSSSGTGGNRNSPGLRTFASSTRQVGSTLSRMVTMPILEAGAASVVFSTEFEAAMTKVQALAGVSGAQVQQWSKQIQALGPAVGEGPKQLADAMFFIASEGYRGAQAMDILTRSAKMAAVGMGETKDDAKAVAFAVHDFGISAKDASDTLVATVRSGNMEIGSLTGSLYKVLLPAAQLHIKFRDLSGGIAALTRDGMSAQNATTALRQFFTALEKPSKQAREELHRLHLSMADLRKMASQDLLKTFFTLSDKEGGNVEGMAKILGNVRAFQAELGEVLGKRTDVIKFFEDFRGSTNDLDKAFATTTQTIQFKFKQMLASLQEAGISLGATLAPAVTAIASDVTNLAQAFAQLSPGVQKTFVYIGLAAAALGPLLSGVATITSAFIAWKSASALLSGALAVQAVAEDGVAASAAAMNLALAPELLIVVALAAAAYGLYKAFQYLTEGTSESTKWTQADLEANQRSAQAKEDHARKVVQLYKEFLTLSKNTKQTAADHEELRKVQNELSILSPDLVKGYDNQNNAIITMDGNVQRLTSDLYDQASAARIAAVMTAKAVGAENALTHRDEARQKLYDLQTRGLPYTEVDQAPNSGAPMEVTKYDKASAPYHAALRQAKADAEAAERVANQAIVVSAQNPVSDLQRAFDTSKGYTPEGRNLADKLRGRWGANVNPRNFGPNFGISTDANGKNTNDYKKDAAVPGGGGDGKRGKESQEQKEEDQRVQSITDKLQNLAQAYRLVGKDKDSASLKDELLGGEYATAAEKLAVYTKTLKDFAKAHRGALEVASKDLFKGKSFESLNPAAEKKYKTSIGHENDAQRRAELSAFGTVNEAENKADEKRKENAKQWLEYLHQGVSELHSKQEELFNQTHPGFADRQSYKVSGMDYLGLKGATTPDAKGKTKLDPKLLSYVDAIVREQDRIDAYEAAESNSKFVDEFVKKAKEIIKARQEAIGHAAGTMGDALSVLSADTQKQNARTPVDRVQAAVQGGLSEHAKDLALLPPILTQIYAAMVATNEQAKIGKEYFESYASATRKLNTELASLGKQTEADRIYNTAFEDGIRKMTDAQATQVVKLQESIDKLKKFQETMKTVADAGAKAFSDTLQQGLDHGMKGLFGSLVKNVRDQIKSILMEIASAKIKQGFEGLLMGKQGQGPKQQGYYGGGGVVSAVMGAYSHGMLGAGGGKTGLPANTTALNLTKQSIDALKGSVDSLTTTMGGTPGVDGGSSIPSLGSFGSLFSGASGGSAAMPNLLSVMPLPGLADGGNYGPGPMIVGERGPELLNPSGGGSVMSNSDLADALSGRGGGDVHVHNHFHGPVPAPNDRRSHDQIGRTTMQAAQKALAKYR